MTLSSIIAEVFKYRALAVTLITAAITLGLGAAADPAIANLVSGHPAVVAFFIAVFHLAQAADKLLGGNPPVAEKP